MNNPFRRRTNNLTKPQAKLIKDYIDKNTPPSGKLQKFSVDLEVSGSVITNIDVMAIDARQAAAIANSKIQLRPHKSYAK